MAGSLLEISDATFDKEVLQSPVPVLVDFWAVWCDPCRRMIPVLEEVAQELGPKVRIVKLNADAYLDFASELGVAALPTFLLFKSGEEVHRISGYMPKSAFLAQLEPRL